MRILIAEDDATSRMILKSILTTWGYEVVETRDGPEAWQALKEEGAPRLVILDRMMPGMNGEEICRKLRETQPLTSTYIILLTSNGEKDDIVEGLEAGANDYNRKPFDRPELRARLRVGERVLELEAALAERIRALQDALAHVKHSKAYCLSACIATVSVMTNRVGSVLRSIFPNIRKPNSPMVFALNA